MYPVRRIGGGHWMSPIQGSGPSFARSIINIHDPFITNVSHLWTFVVDSDLTVTICIFSLKKSIQCAVDSNKKVQRWSIKAVYEPYTLSVDKKE
jgi:hypothetical protein